MLVRSGGMKDLLGMKLGKGNMRSPFSEGDGKVRLKISAKSRASSKCCFWSSPTGTSVALLSIRPFVSSLLISEKDKVAMDRYMSRENRMTWQECGRGVEEEKLTYSTRYQRLVISDM